MNLSELLAQLAVRNSLTIAGELVAVVVTLLVLEVLLRRMARAVVARPSLAWARPGAEAVRRNLSGLLLIVGVLACTGIGAGNGWLWYRGEDLPAWTLDGLRGIDPAVWGTIGTGCAQAVALVFVVAVALRLVRRLLDWLCASAKAYEGIRANDEAVEAFFGALKRVVTRAAWLLVLVVIAGLVQAPPILGSALSSILRIYLAIALGVLVWRALDAVIASLDALSKKYADARNLLRYYDRLHALIPLFRRCVEYAIYVGVATYVAGEVAVLAWFEAWGPRIVRVIGIVFLARVVVEFLNVFLEEVLLTRPKLDRAQRQRRQTIVPLIRSTLEYVVYFWAGIQMLVQFGVDPTPVLAGAGVLALAVGLGAQSLVNDVVSGFFILFENHFLVDDDVIINGVEGKVESIELRTTRLRDGLGKHHVIRNGQIDTLVNSSKGYMNAVVEVGVAYESDVDHVISVLEEVGRVADVELDEILAPSVVQGLEGFGESELLLRTVTRVKPGTYRDVQRELRRRIKKAFDEHGVEMPYARRVLIWKDEQGDPIRVRAEPAAGAA